MPAARVVNKPDNDVARLHQSLERWRAMIKAPKSAEPSVAPDGKRHFLNLFVPATATIYPTLIEWTKTAHPSWWQADPTGGGIWVGVHVLEDHVPKQEKKPWRAPTDDELRAHYGGNREKEKCVGRETDRYRDSDL